MSEEGEVTENSRKYVASEKEGNTPTLYVERSMESVRSPEEEGKLNTPDTATNIITSYLSFPPILVQV